MSVKKNLDYIIVLGAHVDGTRMTLALLERARRALLYLEENPGTKAVLSDQQLPILPGRFQPSTFGVCELNYRVRDGNGCILTAIATISEGCSFKTI